MRLKARTNFYYEGKPYKTEDHLDVPDREAVVLINQDLAMIWNLEDPSQRSDIPDVPEAPAAPPAPVHLSPSSVQMQPAAGSSSFNVIMTGQGSWTASALDTWLHIDSPTGPQTARGPVNFSAQAHNGTVGQPAANRTGTIKVNDAVFTVTQTPWDVLPVELAPKEASLSSAASTGNTFDVTITGSGTSGTWMVDTENAAKVWLTAVSPTSPQSVNGPVTYSVQANTAAPRVGKFFVNGQVFTVNQDGVATRSGESGHHGRH